MACAVSPETISAYVDGELDEDERERVRFHLEEEACQDCLRVHATLSDTAGRVGRLGEVPVPAGLTEGLLAAVRRNVRDRILFWKAIGATMGLTAFAAAVLLFMVGSGRRSVENRVRELEARILQADIGLTRALDEADASRKDFAALRAEFHRAALDHEKIAAELERQNAETREELKRARLLAAEREAKARDLEAALGRLAAEKEALGRDAGEVDRLRESLARVNRAHLELTQRYQDLLSSPAEEELRAAPGIVRLVGQAGEFLVEFPGRVGERLIPADGKGALEVVSRLGAAWCIARATDGVAAGRLGPGSRLILEEATTAGDEAGPRPVEGRVSTERDEKGDYIVMDISDRQGVVPGSILAVIDPQGGRHEAEVVAVFVGHVTCRPREAGTVFEPGWKVLKD